MTTASGGPTAPAAARLRPSDLAALASVGLRTRKLRAGLSATGIAIGVAAIVAVLGLAASSSAALLAEILGAVVMAPDAEITAECNPEDATSERFARWRDAGVNRVSVGVQSLDPVALEMLGRQHSVAQAVAALELARRMFPRVSFDLIYARPGQSVTVIGDAVSAGKSKQAIASAFEAALLSHI